MKVRMTAIPSFRVIGEDGRALGVFQQEGEWLGMVRLVNGRGESLIVDRPNGFTSSFADATGHLTEVDVIKVSPALATRMMQPAAPPVTGEQEPQS